MVAFDILRTSTCAIAILVSLLALEGDAFSSSVPVHQRLSCSNTALPATFSRVKKLFRWRKKEATTTPKDEVGDDDFALRLQHHMQTRRTINDFETDLPSGWEEALERAVMAAIHAPNHKRTEPWRFHLLGKDSVRKVCELNADLVSAKKGKEAGEKKLDRWLKMPGWLVVTCRKSDAGDSSMADPSGLAREDYAACCCAVQNLCLSLHAEGMGTKWTSGPVNFDERFADAAGFSGDEEYTVGTIWFGKPAKVPVAPKKRLPLQDVLIRQN